jgi:hypothetical protein
VEGNVYFMKGRIFYAELGAVKGEDAIYDMIFWEDGFFRFNQGEIPRQDIIASPTNKILSKCQRLLGKA